MAIVIIPNMAGMFYENKTFLKNIYRGERRVRGGFSASLVFLAKPTFKASFVAGYCLSPQVHKNGLS